MNNTVLMLIVWGLTLFCGFLIGRKMEIERKKLAENKTPADDTRHHHFDVEIIDSSEDPPKTKSTHAQKMDALEKEFREKYADGRFYTPHEGGAI